MQKLNIIILTACHLIISSGEIIVVTRSGSIRSTASLSDDVEAFLGIPYAEPPIGDLRFAKPVPKQPWSEVYDASSLSPPCAQASLNRTFYLLPDVSNMSEDCLYLNVWMPKLKRSEDLRPIIINIHPGAFSTGTSSWRIFDGSHLASLGEMVVVTINYRLGSLGFFLAFIEEANGSMGMFDQLMAIQWVKDNAESFGGDPENIALIGGSAGALSIGFHMVSPLSQNLFRRAIMTSGSVISPWFLNGNKNLISSGNRFASLVGCANKTLTLNNDPRAVVKCLKGKPKEILLRADYMLLLGNPIVFYPRVGDHFLPKDAGLMFRDGKFRKDADVMFGTNLNEGGIFLVTILSDYFGIDGENPIAMSRSKVTLIFRTMGRYLANKAGIQNVPDKISLYLNELKNPTSEDYVEMLSHIISDFIVDCSSVFHADLISLKGNRVYYYKFGFRAASTPLAEWVQTTHLDDVQYIFGNPYHENFTAEEVELSNRLIARISSFAKTGNPNIPGEIEWMRYNYNNPLYLFVGQEDESIRLKPFKNCEIWRKDFKSEIDPLLIRSLAGLNQSTISGFTSVHENSFICLLACLCLTVLFRSSFLKQLLGL